MPNIEGVFDNMEEGDATVAGADFEQISRVCVQGMKIGVGKIVAPPDYMSEQTRVLQDMIDQMEGDELGEIQPLLKKLVKSVNDGDGHSQEVVVMNLTMMNKDKHTVVFNKMQALDIAQVISEWALKGMYYDDEEDEE